MITRSALIFMACLGVAACAPRGQPAPIPFDDTATQQRVYLTTTRDTPDLNASFGADRGAGVTYLHADVSIPPVHEVGKIEWPRNGNADPKLHFGIAEAAKYRDSTDFIRSISANADESIIIFVHGFNTRPVEATYALAQMVHDFGNPVTPIAFLWPSAGVPSGYIYDRQSALFARDPLEKLVTDVVAQSNKPVILLAHSLGSFLTLEVLRQLSIKGKDATLSGIEAVMLMSPDLDPDVFDSQLRVIDRLPPQFIILSSEQDYVLRISGLVTGRRTRVGQITESDEWESRGIQILDLGPFASSAQSGHSIAATSPEAIAFLKEYFTSLN